MKTFLIWVSAHIIHISLHPVAYIVIHILDGLSKFYHELSWRLEKIHKLIHKPLE